MVKIAAFTGGRHVPSARFRVRQYIQVLKRYKVFIDEYAAPLGSYPPSIRSLRPLWAAASLASRLPTIVKSHAYELTLLQREMISTTYTLEAMTGAPRVLDVDDAIWLHRRGGFAKKLARCCRAVICGNDFLADYFSQWNSKIFVVPTAVDTNRYVPGGVSSRPIIGWSGTSSGFKYLYDIEPALRDTLQAVPDAILRIVSDRLPEFSMLPVQRVEFVRWSADTEVGAIQEMTIGIMPLRNTDWERGKCSFKMLTYMACGLPVVVSPVGMNQQVLASGNVGFGAVGHKDWTEALTWLLKNASKCQTIGAQARQVVLNQYSLLRVASLLGDIFCGFSDR